MIITKLKVGRFGKLKNFEMDFHSGLNIVCGDNEAGKSTLQAFVKAMLYGMNSQVKKVRDNDRKRYQPWNGDKAHGELHFLDESNHAYIIKKRFGSSKGHDETMVFDAVTGKEATQFKGNLPGEVLFGVGEDAFEKLGFIRQLGCAVASADKDEIRVRLENLRQSGDENVSYQKAHAALVDIEKALKAKKGKLNNLDEEIRSLDGERQALEKLHEENIQDEVAANGLREEEACLQVKIKSLDFKKLQLKSFLLKKQYDEIKYCADKVQDLSKQRAILSSKITCEGVALDEGFLEDAKSKFLLWQQVINQRTDLEERRITAQGHLRQGQGGVVGFTGFASLPEDIQEKIVQAENSKTHLEEKISDSARLVKEAGELEEEILLIKSNLGQLGVFAAVDETVEKTIVTQEERLSRLRQSYAAGDKSDILQVRQGILRDKSNMFFAVGILGMLLTLGGLAGAFFYALWTLALSLVGMGCVGYGIIGRKGLVGEIAELESQLQSQADNKALGEEISALEKALQAIYSPLGVSSIGEFIAGLRKYGEQKQNLETLQGRLRDRQDALECQDGAIYEQLAEKTAFISRVLQTCACHDVEEFLERYKLYAKAATEIIALEHGLQSIEENLQQVDSKAEELAFQLKERLVPFIGREFELSEVESQIELLGEKLKELRELELEIGSTDAAFRLLTRDKSLSEIQEELNALPQIESEQEELLTEQAIDELLKESQDRLLELTKELTENQNNISNRFAEKRSLIQVEQELEKANTDLVHFTELAEATRIANVVLEESFKEIQRDFGPLLNKAAGDVLQAITLGKYHDLRIDEDFGLRITDEEEQTSQEIGYFSNGTWDQIYFALRMGIVNLLFEGDAPMPVILDDTFVQFDDKRLAAVMDYLANYAKEHQVILFSCHQRERHAVKSLNGVNLVNF